MSALGHLRHRTPALLRHIVGFALSLLLWHAFPPQVAGIGSRPDGITIFKSCTAE